MHQVRYDIQLPVLGHNPGKLNQLGYHYPGLGFGHPCERQCENPNSQQQQQRVQFDTEQLLKRQFAEHDSLDDVSPAQAALMGAANSTIAKVKTTPEIRISEPRTCLQLIIGSLLLNEYL